MRRVFTFVALLVAICVSSCAYDDTFVVNSITDLQKRVALLEQLQNASDKGLLIDSITEIEEGYIIKFSDGSEITVYHGKDGENGADGNDGADGKDGENGKDGADGKDGSDANCIIADIVIGEDTITIYLSDGTSFTFNRVKEEVFDVVFANAEGLVCYPGASVEVGYTIVGGDDKTTIESFGDGGWSASVIKESSTTGKIIVTAPHNENTLNGKIVVIALSGGNKTCMKSINIDKGVIVDILDSYEVDCYNGHLEVYLRTNIDYEVVISEDAQYWLNVIETRSSLRDSVIAFEYEDNDSRDKRIATIQIVSKDGHVLHSFEIIQKGNAYVGNISFADQIVKRVCLDKFDIDCNGELSYAEALKVTKISSNFFGEYSDSVKVFDELQYFANLKTIEDYAFKSCKKLISISLPDNITSIKYGAFEYCNSLINICISNINSWCNIQFSDSSSNPLINGGNLYIDNEVATVITIPYGVSKIENYTFYNCISLTSVTIPDSVTTIGNSAFSGCGSLTSITIPDSVTTIGDWAFYNCSSLTSVTIPDSVTTIGSSAFRNCSSLTSVTIPDSVTTIGWYAFYYCSSLTSITIPDSVTTIGDYAFYQCSSLTSVTIPDSVTTIGHGAFSGCSSLQEFNGKFASEDGRCFIVDGVLNSFAIGCGATEYAIPDGVTTIGDGAFNGCDSLTNVTIPDSVTTIGESAFNNCDSLTSITIPDSVTTIGSNAFWSCSSLTSVYCKATIPPVAILNDYGKWNAFNDNASGRNIYVPIESVNKYKSASYWSSYSDYIEGYNF